MSNRSLSRWTLERTLGTGHWPLVVGHWGVVNSVAFDNYFNRSVAKQRIPKFLISHFSFLIKKDVAKQRKPKSSIFHLPSSILFHKASAL